MTESQYLNRLEMVIAECTVSGPQPELRIVDKDDVVTLTVECKYPKDHIYNVNFDLLAEKLQTPKPYIDAHDYEHTTKNFRNGKVCTGFGSKPVQTIYDCCFLGRKLRLLISCNTEPHAIPEIR